jgi:hypothetical protein
MAAWFMACGGLASDGSVSEAGNDGTGGGAGSEARSPGDPAFVPPDQTNVVVRETCEDNPLLAGCSPPLDDPVSYEPGLVCNGPRGSAGCAPSPSASGEEEIDDLIPEGSQASFVLLAYCGPCHTPAAAMNTGAIPGPTDIQDWGLMMQEGYIESCSADRSPLIAAMQDAVQIEVPSDDIETVKRQIEVDCTDAQKRCASSPEEPGCVGVRVELMLEQRCGSCHGAAGRAEAARAGVSVEGMSYIDNLPRLIEDEKLIACEPNRSPILRRAQDGSMPPAPARKYPFSERDVALLTGFIDGLCPGSASSAPEAAEQRRIEASLEAQCGECHGAAAAESGQVQGQLGDIGSVDALIRGGRIVPCLSDASSVVGRIEDGSMPPPDSFGPRPSEDDQRALRAYIDRPCAGP